MKKLAVIFTLMLMPALLLAQPPGGPGVPGQGLAQGAGPGMGRGQGFFRDVDLTQEQRQQLRALRDKRQDMRGSREEMMNEREALHKLLADPAIDESEILKRAEEMRKRQADMFAKRLENMLEVRRIVGAEKFGKMADKFRDKMRGGFAQRNGGGMGMGFGRMRGGGGQRSQPE